METARNREGVGEVTDISASGAGMIVTCGKLEDAARLDMWLEIPGRPEPLHAKGRVSWLKTIVPGIFRIGIIFDKVDFMAIAQALKLKV